MKSGFAALAIQDSYVTRWRLAGWLGRRDSKSRVTEQRTQGLTCYGSRAGTPGGEFAVI
jgi:hypothetical protein